MLINIRKEILTRKGKEKKKKRNTNFKCSQNIFSRKSIFNLDKNYIFGNLKKKIQNLKVFFFVKQNNKYFGEKIKKDQKKKKITIII